MNYQDKNWLENQYINLKKSTLVISKECGVSSTTIRKWMIIFNIIRRKEVGKYKKERKLCKNCRTFCKGPHDKYCNIQCQLNYQYKQYINKWLKKEIEGNVKVDAISSHIIRFLKERSNNKCERCGWHEINIFTKRVPLQVHHKDGHYKNSYEENLEYICPNCHSLTESYGNKNKGNGRCMRLNKIRSNKLK
jgi:Zn finger protein HypA/HybF involved in hydrogenase expression